MWFWPIMKPVCRHMMNQNIRTCSVVRPSFTQKSCMFEAIYDWTKLKELFSSRMICLASRVTKFLKIAQSVAHHVIKIYKFFPWKKVAQKCGLLCNEKKTSQRKNHPLGENSPKMITLLAKNLCNSTCHNSVTTCIPYIHVLRTPLMYVRKSFIL
jgi:hypothetical protein